MDENTGATNDTTQNNSFSSHLFQLVWFRYDFTCASANIHHDQTNNDTSSSSAVITKRGAGQNCWWWPAIMYPSHIQSKEHGFESKYPFLNPDPLDLKLTLNTLNETLNNVRIPVVIIHAPTMTGGDIVLRRIPILPYEESTRLRYDFLEQLLRFGLVQTKETLGEHLYPAYAASLECVTNVLRCMDSKSATSKPFRANTSLATSLPPLLPAAKLPTSIENIIQEETAQKKMTTTRTNSNLSTVHQSGPSAICDEMSDDNHDLIMRKPSAFRKINRVSLGSSTNGSKRNAFIDCTSTGSCSVAESDTEMNTVLTDSNSKVTQPTDESKDNYSQDQVMDVAWNWPEIGEMESWNNVWIKLQLAGWFERKSPNNDGTVWYVRTNTRSGSIENIDYFTSEKAVQELVRAKCGWQWSEESAPALQTNKKNSEKSVIPKNSKYTEEKTKKQTSTKKGFKTKNTFTAKSTKPNVKTTTLSKFKNTNNLSKIISTVQENIESKTKGPVGRPKRANNGKEKDNHGDQQSIATDHDNDETNSCISPNSTLLSNEDATSSSSSEASSSIDSAEKYCFRRLWPELKKCGWTYKKATNRLYDFYYIPPFVDIKVGTVNVDFFTDTSKVIEYIKAQDNQLKQAKGTKNCSKKRGAHTADNNDTIIHVSSKRLRTEKFSSDSSYGKKNSRNNKTSSYNKAMVFHRQDEVVKKTKAFKRTEVVAPKAPAFIHSSNDEILTQYWFNTEPFPDFLKEVWPILQKLQFSWLGGKYTHSLFPSHANSANAQTLRRYMCQNGIPNVEQRITSLDKNEIQTLHRWVSFANVPLSVSNIERTLKEIQIPSDPEIIRLLTMKFGFQRKQDLYYPPGINPEDKNLQEIGRYVFKGLPGIRDYIRGATDLQIDVGQNKYRNVGRRGKQNDATPVDETIVRVWAAMSPSPLPTFGNNFTHDSKQIMALFNGGSQDKNNSSKPRTKISDGRNNHCGNNQIDAIVKDDVNPKLRKEVAPEVFDSNKSTAVSVCDENDLQSRQHDVVDKQILETIHAPVNDASIPSKEILKEIDMGGLTVPIHKDNGCISIVTTNADVFSPTKSGLIVSSSPKEAFAGPGYETDSSAIMIDPLSQAPLLVTHGENTILLTQLEPEEMGDSELSNPNKILGGYSSTSSGCLVAATTYNSEYAPLRTNLDCCPVVDLCSSPKNQACALDVGTVQEVFIPQSSDRFDDTPQIVPLPQTTRTNENTIQSQELSAVNFPPLSSKGSESISVEENTTRSATGTTSHAHMTFDDHFSIPEIGVEHASNGVIKSDRTGTTGTVNAEADSIIDNPTTTTSFCSDVSLPPSPTRNVPNYCLSTQPEADGTNNSDDDCSISLHSGDDDFLFG